MAWGSRQVAVVRPMQEDFEGVAAAFDGVGGVVSNGEVFEVAGGLAGEAAGRAGGEFDGGVAAAFVLGAVAEVFAALVAFLAVGHGVTVIRGLGSRCALAARRRSFP